MDIRQCNAPPNRGAGIPNPGERRGRPRLKSQLFLLASLVMALGLKLHYRQAGPGELAWVLAPTAQLVSLASGVDFEFECGAGWMSHSRAFVIAPQCAGINFLVIVALSLSLVTLRERPGRHTLLWWAVAQLVAYGATLMVNALRIVLALEGPQWDGLPGLAAAQQHRWAGVVTYLAGLWVTMGAWRRLCPPSAGESGGRSGSRRPAGRGWLWIPPAVYLAIVLGVPLVRASQSGLAPRFASHSATVVAGCLFVWGGLFLLQRILTPRKGARRGASRVDGRDAVLKRGQRLVGVRPSMGG